MPQCCYVRYRRCQASKWLALLYARPLKDVRHGQERVVYDVLAQAYDSCSVRCVKLSAENVLSARVCPPDEALFLLRSRTIIYLVAL